MPELISPSIIGRRERFLLYGDPGMGKSECAMTIPGPIYAIGVGGPNEFKTYYSTHFQERMKKRGYHTKLYIDSVVDTFDIDNPKSQATGFDGVKRLVENAFELEAKGEFQFESIIIDNFTVLTEYQINKAIKLSDANRPADAKGKSTLEKAKESGGVNPADFEWKDVQNMMQKFLSELFTVDKHIVCVAHEWDQTVSNRATQQSDVIGVKPLLIGKQRDRIANMFDNVWRFYVQGQFYVARTVPIDKPFTVIAKTRIGGVVDADYVNPDLTETIEKFKKYAEKMEAITSKLEK